MTDDNEKFDPAKERVRIAQNLSAIEDMFAKLRTEAINRAGDPNIPGGAAMVLLGPGADIEAFGYAQMSELFGRTRGTTEIALAGDVEPPLSFLAGWADIIRDARGQELSRKRATISSEARYIRAAIDWVLATDDDGRLWWMQALDFADGLYKVRRAMENALKAGTRHERINAECKFCDKPERLIVMKGDADDGSKDWWRCPSGKHSYDIKGVRECWTQMFIRRGDAPEWVTLRQAASAVNRAVGTVYKWTLPGLDTDGMPVKAPIVDSERRDDGALWVRWADVRAADDTRKRRRSVA